MADDTTTPETEVTTEPPAADKDNTSDLKAELAKWREMAKKSESMAKANASAAEKLARIEESSKTELERAMAKATEAEAKAAAAEERIAKALTRAAVMAAAAKSGAIDADAVLALLPSDAVTIDGDDVRGVD